MKNEITKEQWIDNVMGSLEGISRADAGGDTYRQVITRLNNGQPGRPSATRVTQWAAAAIILLALNVGSIAYFDRHRHGGDGHGQSNPFAMEIQSESTYNY